VLTIDSSARNVLDAWFLEGGADVSITPDGKLLIDNVTKPIDGLNIFRSTLRYRESIWGDLPRMPDAWAVHPRSRRAVSARRCYTR